MPLVASLNTAGDTLRNMMLSNWFLPLAPTTSLFLQSEKGKRWFHTKAAPGGNPSVRKYTHQDNGAEFWGVN